MNLFYIQIIGFILFIFYIIMELSIKFVESKLLLKEIDIDMKDYIKNILEENNITEIEILTEEEEIYFYSSKEDGEEIKEISILPKNIEFNLICNLHEVGHAINNKKRSYFKNVFLNCCYYISNVFFYIFGIAALFYFLDYSFLFNIVKIIFFITLLSNIFILIEEFKASENGFKMLKKINITKPTNSLFIYIPYYLSYIFKFCFTFFLFALLLLC